MEKPGLEVERCSRLRGTIVLSELPGRNKYQGREANFSIFVRWVVRIRHAYRQFVFFRENVMLYAVKPAFAGYIRLLTRSKKV
jgi:hypothetical protein